MGRGLAITAVTTTLVLAACGGGDDDTASVTTTEAATATTAPPTTEAPTTAAAPTTEVPTTTEAPTTTAAPTTTTAAPTRTDAPTTTADTAGTTISRDTAIAADRCISGWNELRGLGRRAGFYPLEDKEAALTACDEATRLLEIDTLDSPVGPLPTRELTIILLNISIAVQGDTLGIEAAGCESDGFCLVPEADQATFVDLAPTGNRAFDAEWSLISEPSLDDIDGLVVE